MNYVTKVVIVLFTLIELSNTGLLEDQDEYEDYDYRSSWRDPQIWLGSNLPYQQRSSSAESYITAYINKDLIGRGQNYWLDAGCVDITKARSLRIFNVDCLILYHAKGCSQSARRDLTVLRPSKMRDLGSVFPETKRYPKSLKTCASPIENCKRFGHFACGNGRCIRDRSKVCDRRNDCGDGSDELKCGGQCNCGLQRPVQKPCLVSGGCYSSVQTCNRVNDCTDGTDERNCFLPKCSCSGSCEYNEDGDIIYCIPCATTCSVTLATLPHCRCAVLSSSTSKSTCKCVATCAPKEVGSEDPLCIVEVVELKRLKLDSDGGPFRYTCNCDSMLALYDESPDFDCECIPTSSE